MAVVAAKHGQAAYHAGDSTSPISVYQELVHVGVPIPKSDAERDAGCGFESTFAILLTRRQAMLAVGLCRATKRPRLTRTFPILLNTKLGTRSSGNPKKWSSQ
jgi:hypothetical protein